MDLATFSGIFLGVAAIGYSLTSGQVLNVAWNLPSFLLVIGGTFASTLLTFPFGVLKNIPKSFLLTFFPQKKMSSNAVIDRLCKLSDIALTKGIDALPEKITAKDNHFLKSGIDMLLNDWGEKSIKESMEKDLDFILDRHQEIQKVFASAGGYAPVYGLMGTLIGILTVLRDLGNPKAMGLGMMVAILTTFYGIVFANLILLPAAGKLGVLSSQELLTKQIILIGVLSIKKEESSFVLRSKAEKYISKCIRKKALKVVNKSGNYLGKGLSFLIDIINPEMIIVGSMGVRLGELLFEPARKVIEKEAVPGAASVCEIVPAALGEAIGDYAALCVALNDYRD